MSDPVFGAPHDDLGEFLRAWRGRARGHCADFACGWLARCGVADAARHARAAVRAAGGLRAVMLDGGRARRAGVAALMAMGLRERAVMARGDIVVIDQGGATCFGVAVTPDFAAFRTAAGVTIMRPAAPQIFGRV